MVDACFALWLLFTCQSPQRVSLLSRGVERSKDCPAPFRAFVDKGEKNKGRETEVEVEVGSPVGAFAFCFLHFLSIFHLRSPTLSEKGKSERQGFRYAWLLAGLHFASRSRGTSRGHSEIPRKTEDAVERLNGAGFRAVCLLHALDWRALSSSTSPLPFSRFPLLVARLLLWSFFRGRVICLLSP